MLNNVKTTALVTISISSFTSAFMMSSIHLALPAIQHEFSADAVSLSWIVTGHIIGSAAFFVPMGKFADIYGRKRIFIIGMTLFAIGTLLSGLASSVHALIGMRIFQGIASSLRLATGSAILISVFPESERGKALGIMTACVYAGTSSGPAFGGLLTQHLGWRSIFLLMVPVTLLVLTVAAIGLKEESGDTKSERFDYRGSMLYSLGFVMCFYGATQIPHQSSLWLLILGSLTLGIFLRLDNRSAHPILNATVLVKNRRFAYSCLAMYASYACTYSTPFLLSLFFQFIKGFNAKSTGLILLGQPVLQMIFSPLAGKLCDRVGAPKIASFGMVITLIAVGSLIFIHSGTHFIFILSALVLLGVGYGLFSSPNSYAVMNSVDEKKYGLASGVMSTVRSVGMVSSMAITTILFTLYIGRHAIEPSTFSNLIQCTKISFIISTCFCIAGIYFSMARGMGR